MTVNERGKLMRATIANATIRVLAADGVARLSFRRVAKEAGESLALINYHCPTRRDLLANASEPMLTAYVAAFERAALTLASDSDLSLRDFTLHLLQIAISRERTLTCAWSEVMLDAGRHPPTLQMTGQWKRQTARLWKLIAQAAGNQADDVTAIGAMDVAIGMIFLAFGIGLNAAALAPVLLDKASPLDVWAPRETAGRAPGPLSRKSEQTRRAIVDAAIATLIEKGPGALSFRAISNRSGLAASGPAYHFGTIDAVLACAQAELIEQSKQRYRSVMNAVDRSGIGMAEFSELTTTIFIVEATRFSGENLALFGNWIEASRHEALQPVIWSFVRDQCVAWQRALESAGNRTLPSSVGVIGLTLFVGKLIRILSTGADINALSGVRSEFSRQFENLVNGRFW